MGGTINTKTETRAGETVQYPHDTSYTLSETNRHGSEGFLTGRARWGKLEDLKKVESIEGIRNHKTWIQHHVAEGLWAQTQKGGKHKNGLLYWKEHTINTEG